MFGFSQSRKHKNPIKADGEVLALSLLTLGESLHSFSSFMPSRFTIKNWVLDGNQQEIDKKVADLRSGYLPSLSLSLGLGAVIAYIAKSPLPFMFAAGGSAVMVGLYEQALPPERRLLCGPSTNPATPELRPIDMFMFGSALL